MQMISRGQRIKLDDLGLSDGSFSIKLFLPTIGLSLDAACFGLDAAKKLSDERYMTFFNQPTSPCGAIKQSEPGRFDFELSKLPSSIDSLTMTLAIANSGVLRTLEKSRATFFLGGSETASFEFDGGLFADERAIMLVEIYRKDGRWRLNAIAQGFNGGLDALVKHFGGTVADATPLPNVSLSKVTLSKKGESHKVSLSKGPSAPQKIIVKATWTDNGDEDDDNDDLDLRVGILLPDGKTMFIQAPERSGSFASKPYVRHLGDVSGVSSGGSATEIVEVNPRISHELCGPVVLVFSVYSALANGAVSVGSLSPVMRMEYGNQVVECVYDFSNSPEAHDSSIYTYVIGLIQIDGDTITLNASGETSQPGSENTPWITRKGENYTVTMDGPAVFKGKDEKKSNEYNKNNPRRYV